MRPRYVNPPFFVVVACMVTVAVFVGVDRSRSIAIAGDKPAANGASKAGDDFSAYVDKDGNISLPKGYKQNWAHLGSWAVARKLGSDVFEVHDVYTPAETITAYSKTGEFPDGAVLMKEVRKAKTDRLKTGHAAWSTDMKIWFVMIKDQKGRFEDNDHWGDGWGWALFEAKDPTKNVSAGYETSCIDCHSPVEESDWVYVYGYPELDQPKK